MKSTPSSSPATAHISSSHSDGHPSSIKPVNFAIVLAAASVVLWLALRLVLGLDLWQGAKVSALNLATAFSTGAWFDIWTLAYLVSPLLITAALLPNKWRASNVVNLLRWLLLCIALASLLFGVVAEFVFWQEFTTRFNFIAVDYLIYTKEVIGNIRESYPVPLILGSIAVIAGLLTWAISRKINFRVTALTGKQRLGMLVMAIVLPCLSFAVANVDQMQRSSNVYANELAGNGLFTLVAAMRRNELDYDQFYNTIPQGEADATLYSLGVERVPLSQAITDPKSPTSVVESTRVPANVSHDVHEAGEMGGFTRRPKNIVLITVESLSADYVGAYGNKQNLTPNLDKIAAQGLKFDRIFATGTRTVRGLDALTLGAPPIPGQAIIHRPDNEHLATIGEFLENQGYATFFIYGGYGYFDNMNAYFKANDYNVIDRTDFDPKEIASENVWGVADESLFNHTLKTLDEHTVQMNTTLQTGNGSHDKTQYKPFFAQLMTTSNHRPYTFPAGRIDLPQGQREGAVKYTDYAIGKFLEDAKSKPWFKDTLFVIVADHCASVAGKTSLPVEKYHIPVIFYAPDMIKPGNYTRMASQLDLPPTLLDLLGAKGDNHFFGESLFEAKDKPSRAFISNYQKLGYYKDDQLIVLSPKHKIEAFKVDPITLESEPVAVDPALAQEAVAYYQTAARAFKQGALKEYADNYIPPKALQKTILSSK